MSLAATASKYTTASEPRSDLILDKNPYTGLTVIASGMTGYILQLGDDRVVRSQKPTLTIPVLRLLPTRNI